MVFLWLSLACIGLISAMLSLFELRHSGYILKQEIMILLFSIVLLAGSSVQLSYIFDNAMSLSQNSKQGMAAAVYK